MSGRQAIMRQMREEMEVGTSTLQQISADFCAAIEARSRGKESSLQMLPSFLDLPTGKETGCFLALDFGGTNVRAMLVHLDGRTGTVVKQRSVPLRAVNGTYDYTAKTSSAEELFDFLARLIITVAEEQPVYYLGHTFSFPCRQISRSQAELIAWTKEIATPGVEGREVGSLLQAALDRHQSRITQTAILNDTVGTLLAAAYRYSTADIGAICGTGHNLCFRRAGTDRADPMIYNLESGNFSCLIQNRYDRLLDDASEKPGAQVMEKMVGGQYLGELVRRMALGAADHGILSPRCEQYLSQPYSLTAIDLACFLNPVFANRAANLRGFAVQDEDFLAGLAYLACRRSARLAAAALVGVLRYSDPEVMRKHTIGIDGSLYRKFPGYADWLRSAVEEVLPDQVGALRITAVQDGSGIGAAIAAAIASPK
ncbi:MAG: Hexokinase [Firmicutes bacterium]|nr:Hexokinase [Bacillota bacterium]